MEGSPGSPVEKASSGLPVVDGPVRVLIVDAHAMFAQGLARILADEPDILPVGTAQTIQEALLLARAHRPNLVLIDVDLPDQDAVAGIAELHNLLPDVSVVVLTATESPELAKAAALAGTRGYISKHRSVERLLAVIRQAATGRMVVMDEVVPSLSSTGKPDRIIAQPGLRSWQKLTPRELETLAVLASGMTAAQAGVVLHISPLTVRSHVKGILSKLGVRSTLEAVTVAVRHGLIDLGRSA
jgi:DNA-binding NarL/FixJ family response regulator